MKRKNKVLLTSLATIAMSASMIAGGTYALFTSESEVNIAVTSGKVEVVANVNGLTHYTNGEPQTEKWVNGGKAGFTANTVTLTNITPGDSVSFDIDIMNESNVDVRYRTLVDVVSDNGLVSGLDITVAEKGVENSEETFTGFAYQDWTKLSPKTEEKDAEKVKTLTITIGLDEDKGNEYQDEEAKLSVVVEAVQGNASYVNTINGLTYNASTLDENGEPTEYYVTNATDLKIFGANVNGGMTYLGKTVKLTSDIDLNGQYFTPIGTGSHYFFGTFDGAKTQAQTVSFLSASTEEYPETYTVSDFYVNQKEGAGLFGSLGYQYINDKYHSATIQNVSVDNATIVSNHYAGGIVGYIWGDVINCTVTNSTITVTPNWDKTAKKYDNGDKAGGIVGWAAISDIQGNTVKNVKISAYRDLGGLVGCFSEDNNTVVNNTVVTTELSYVCLPENAEIVDDKVNENANALIGRNVDTVSQLSLNSVASITLPFGKIDNAEKYTVATTTEDLKDLLDGSDITIDMQGKAVGDLNYGLTQDMIPEGTTVTIANAKVEGRSYGNGVNGTVIFENCTFSNTGAYSIHFDNGAGKVIFNNCKLIGWCSFGNDINVEMNNCTVSGNGTYGIVRFYSNSTLNNCIIDCSNVNTNDVYHDGVSAVDDATVTMKDCTVLAGGYEKADDGEFVLENSTIYVSSTDDLSEALTTGGTVCLSEDVNFDGATVEITSDAVISGSDVTISAATFTVADETEVAFEGVTFEDATTVQATEDGSLKFTDCEFEIAPNNLANNSRAAAIIGSNQNNTVDLYLDGCAFTYQESADPYNAAIFMWSSVKNCEIKKCTFDGYGFVAVKLMNVAEGANILFEGNTFNMSKKNSANYWYNCAVQIVPQHDRTMAVTFKNNEFNGDYQTANEIQSAFGFAADNTNSIVVEIAGMNYAFALTKLTFEQSGNTLNGSAITDDNFALKVGEAVEGE